MKFLKRGVAFLLMLAIVGTSVLIYTPLEVRAEEYGDDYLEEEFDDEGEESNAKIVDIELHEIETTLYRGHNITKDKCLLEYVELEVFRSDGTSYIMNYETGFDSAEFYIGGHEEMNRYENPREDWYLLTSFTDTFDVYYEGFHDGMLITIHPFPDYAETVDRIEVGTTSLTCDKMYWDYDRRMYYGKTEVCFLTDKNEKIPYDIFASGDNLKDYEIQVNLGTGLDDWISDSTSCRTKPLGYTYCVLRVEVWTDSVEDTYTFDLNVLKAPAVNNNYVYKKPSRTVYIEGLDDLNRANFLDNMVIATVYEDDSMVKTEYSRMALSEYARLGLTPHLVYDERFIKIGENILYETGVDYSIDLRYEDGSTLDSFEIEYITLAEAEERGLIDELKLNEDIEVYFDGMYDKKVYEVDIEEAGQYMVELDVDYPVKRGEYNVIIQAVEIPDDYDGDYYSRIDGGETLSYVDDNEIYGGLKAVKHFVVFENLGGNIGQHPLRAKIRSTKLEKAEIVEMPVDQGAYPFGEPRMAGLKVEVTYADDGTTEVVEYNSTRWRTLEFYYDIEETDDKMIYHVYQRGNSELLFDVEFEKRTIDECTSITDFEVNTVKSLTFEQEPYWKVFRFVPKEDGEYRFYGMSGDISMSKLFKGNEEIWPNEDQEWESEWEYQWNYEYQRREILEGGETYYFVAMTDYPWDGVRLAISDDETEVHLVFDWETIEGQEPTCDLGGREKGTCSICGSEVERDVPPLGHDYEDEYTEDKESTEDEEGEESRHCKHKNCKAKKDKRKKPKKGTVYDDVHQEVDKHDKKDKDDKDKLTKEEKDKVKDQVKDLSDKSKDENGKKDAKKVKDNLDNSDVIGLEELYVEAEDAVAKTRVVVNGQVDDSVVVEGAALTAVDYKEGTEGICQSQITITTDEAATSENALVLDIDMSVVDAQTGEPVSEEAADVQPMAPVTITMKVPENLEPGFTIVHVSDDGTEEIIDDYEIIEVNGEQYVQFIATSFSKYSLVLDSAHVHDWCEIAGEFKKSTCIAEGYIVWECKCGQQKEQILSMDADAHGYEFTNTIEATCTEKGYEEHKCVYCGDIKKRNETEALGHDYEEIIDKLPSCVEKGKFHKVCTQCKDGKDGNISGTIDYVDHVVAIDKATITCTEDGYTEGTHCAVCQEVLLKPEKGHAIGHNYVDGICTNCNESENPDEPVDPDTPDIPENPDKPDSTGECIKYVEVELSEADLVLFINEVEAGTYTFAKADKGWTIQNEDGKYIALKNDKIVYEEKAFVWTYKNANFSATEKGSGFLGNWFGSSKKTYYLVQTEGILAASQKSEQAKVSFANKTVKDKHEFDDGIVIEPTCTEDGYTEFTCKECAYSVVVDVKEAIEHKYVEGICENCGDGEDIESECTYEKEVALDEGTYTLKLGGKNVGVHTFAKGEKGWTIQSEDGMYVAFEDKDVTYSDTSYEWAYSNGCFSTTAKKSGNSSSNGWLGGILGNWFGSSSKTTYYLVADGIMTSVSTSNKNALATFYVEGSGEHEYGEAVAGNGNHISRCTNCGEEKIEICTDKDCTLCNPEEPEITEVSMNVSVSVTKKTTGNSWLGGIFGKKTTYTAIITVEAEGTEVESVSYSTNNGKTWKKGTNFTSNTEIKKFDIRVKAANGETYDFAYANGKVTKK